MFFVLQWNVNDNNIVSTTGSETMTEFFFSLFCFFTRKAFSPEREYIYIGFVWALENLNRILLWH